MKLIDLRSDTITKPTSEMIQAMAHAEVGDDNFGEDPTLNHLEKIAAERMGKEAALFLPTGRMGNEVAILVHTQRGDEIITDADSHIYNSELSAPAVISSVLVKPVPVRKGIMNVNDVRPVIREYGSLPRTGLLCIENSHNKAGGIAVPLQKMEELCNLAREHRVPVHVDGARIFNSSVALGVPASTLVRNADSVMFSLSKALCLPFGCILAGNKAFIQKARVYRKLCGGQMGQVGYVAAAGIVALNKMVDRIAEDHEKARNLAKGLSGLKGIILDSDTVQTNIVIFDISHSGFTAQSFLSSLIGYGIKAYAFTEKLIRMVPTRHTTNEDIETTISCVSKVLKSKRL